MSALLSAGLLLLAAPARAQEQPPPPPPTVVVVVPSAPGAVQGPGPAPLPPPEAPPTAPAPYPYPYPYYYAPQPPPPPLSQRSKSQFSAKLWAGPAYQKLFDVDIYSGAFGVSIGAQRGISGWYGEMQGNIGSTVHGLATYQYWAGGSWEGTLDRVHLGLGLHLGVLSIVRATDGTTMSGFGYGGFVFGSVDLYQTEAGHALYLGLRMTLDDVSTNPVYGPSASLGWRF